METRVYRMSATRTTPSPQPAPQSDDAVVCALRQWTTMDPTVTLPSAIFHVPEAYGFHYFHQTSQQQPILQQQLATLVEEWGPRMEELTDLAGEQAWKNGPFLFVFLMVLCGFRRRAIVHRRIVRRKQQQTSGSCPHETKESSPARENGKTTPLPFSVLAQISHHNHETTSTRVSADFRHSSTPHEKAPTRSFGSHFPSSRQASFESGKRENFSLPQSSTPTVSPKFTPKAAETPFLQCSSNNNIHQDVIPHRRAWSEWQNEEESSRFPAMSTPLHLQNDDGKPSSPTPMRQVPSKPRGSRKRQRGSSFSQPTSTAAELEETPRKRLCWEDPYHTEKEAIVTANKRPRTNHDPSEDSSIGVQEDRDVAPRRSVPSKARGSRKRKHDAGRMIPSLQVEANRLFDSASAAPLTIKRVPSKARGLRKRRDDISADTIDGTESKSTK
uniref:Uncharacterized protein n=1 Tax=Entomoneis paludosa TaxID=265537 RepID=A0A7S3DPY0_9STRA|mmetsp:Transcript_27143/g.56857  ORF Transcript_27143/g.56857 Transcript_27143/m.56857 type:complete len:443 (+) Transcript_27143:72-1400(+)